MITCFSWRHFHEAAEAATLDPFRPPVSEIDAVSSVCHIVKLNPPPQTTGYTCNIPSRHAGRPACLNIRSHPEAWESRRSEPVRAAALYCLEGVDRVSRGAYSHRGCVSFGVTCSCAFCLQLWLVKLRLVKCVSDGHVCLPRWEEEHFL